MNISVFLLVFFAACVADICLLFECCYQQLVICNYAYLIGEILVMKFLGYVACLMLLILYCCSSFLYILKNYIGQSTVFSGLLFLGNHIWSLTYNRFTPRPTQNSCFFDYSSCFLLKITFLTFFLMMFSLAYMF